MKKKKISREEIETSLIIQSAARALYKKFKVDPFVVVGGFDLFSSDFFENTPKDVQFKVVWKYLRDGGTHSAFVYNTKTGQVRLVQRRKYWDCKDGQKQTYLESVRSKAKKDIVEFEKACIAWAKDFLKKT